MELRTYSERLSGPHRKSVAERGCIFINENIQDFAWPKLWLILLFLRTGDIYVCSSQWRILLSPFLTGRPIWGLSWWLSFFLLHFRSYIDYVTTDFISIFNLTLMPHHTKGLAQFHLFGMKYIRQEAHNFLYIKVLKIIYKWNILKFVKDL